MVAVPWRSSARSTLGALASAAEGSAGAGPSSGAAAAASRPAVAAPSSSKAVIVSASDGLLWSVGPPPREEDNEVIRETAPRGEKEGSMLCVIIIRRYASKYAQTLGVERRRPVLPLRSEEAPLSQLKPSCLWLCGWRARVGVWERPTDDRDRVRGLLAAGGARFHR